MRSGPQSNNLDALRALAVGAVFCGHLVQTFFFRGGVVGRISRFGVMAFFVHTAVVLMRSLERMDSEASGDLALRFYVRRIFRIYPLSTITVLLVWYFGIPANPGEHFVRVSLRTLAANLALAQNVTHSPSVLSPLWSLPYEVQMYALLPLCFLLVKKARVHSVWIWLAAFALCLLPFPSVRALVQYFPCFLAGVMAWQWRNAASVRSVWWPVYLVLLCGVYAGVELIVLSKVPSQWQHRTLMPIDWACAVAIGCAIPYFREMPASETRVAHLVAKYSYGVYLSHLPVMWFVLVPMAAMPIAWRIAVLAAGCSVLPIAAYHLIERPAIDAAKRWTCSGVKRVAVPA